jgi:D-glycero-D-manno-heptose 1,7-bisphosphate phosphatase
VGVGEVRRAVFLDRDGVLNRALVREGKPYPPATAAELEILPEVPEALGRLKAAGYLLIVVTNQPDVARGTTARAAVDAINAVLTGALPLDEVRVCDHDDRPPCHCRKPRPGMLTDAARQHGIDLSRSWMVGDRWRDVAAGAAAGCRTVWIDREYWEKWQGPEPDFRVIDLAQGADVILNHSEITT